VPSLNYILSIEINNSGKYIVASNTIIDDNVVIKVAKKILQITRNDKYGVTINLKKNIPIGAGLGGGSSNAATILIEINRMLNLNLSIAELIDISSSIGDDIKFFLMQQKSMYFDGLSYHTVNINQPLHVLLVKPNFSISTAEVFQLYREQYPKLELQPIVQQAKIIEHILNGDNHLFNIAKKIQPKVIKVITEIQRYKGLIVSRMSGSGSGCFGIFEDYKSLKIARNEISRLYPEWFLHDCLI
jgi:4-diphosphocytidyl-2-C-methyl-D-erythritol kinase